MVTGGTMGPEDATLDPTDGDLPSTYFPKDEEEVDQTPTDLGEEDE